MPGEETRGEGSERSVDADRNVRRGAPSRGSTRDAGEHGRRYGIGTRVNVRKRITRKDNRVGGVGKRRRRLLLFRGSGGGRGGWIVNLFCTLRNIIAVVESQFAKAVVKILN